MSAHVFIVDHTTFPVHLEHKFAGIGAPLIKFNSDGSLSSSLTTREEITAVSMLADMARIRIGDKIYFYVQGVQSGSSGHQGYFLGRFTATSIHLMISKERSLFFEYFHPPLKMRKRTFFEDRKVAVSKSSK